MSTLVLGAAGMLGSDVMRLAPGAVGLGRDDVDVTDAHAVDSAVDSARPDVVLNCAAYTDVDGAEKEAERALRVNGEGAGNVARAAARARALAVYVSSDYVFDGSKREPYVESDPVAPLSSYGRSKLAGERATAAAGGRHLIVRSSWLFGTAGRNFVDTMLRVARERGEAKVVDDQVGCPTYTGHLAEGLLELAERGDEGVVHLAGGGSCSWYELAREIYSRSGVDCRVTPCTTAEFPRPAPRPANSVLRSERSGVTLPPWQEGLDAYLAQRSVRA